MLADCGGKHGQGGQALTGPLVHPCFAACEFFGVGDLAVPDRAGRSPWCPPCRIVGGPLGDVKVERPDGEQGTGRGRPGRAGLYDVPVCGY